MGRWRLYAVFFVLVFSLTGMQAGVSPATGRDTACVAETWQEHSSRRLVRDFTGKELDWEQLMPVGYTGNDAYVDQAGQDFDLRTRLPTGGAELSALIASRQGKARLPLLLNESGYFAGTDLRGHNLFLSALRETGEGVFADLVFSVLTPEDQVLHFTRQNVRIAGLGTELCHLQMWLEEEVNTDDTEFPITIRGSMDLDSASYVEFSCEGFERFQLLCEYRFPSGMLIPVTPGQDRVRAVFRLTSSELGSFIGSVTVDPFEINGVDDVRFEIREAIIDYSTGENHASMLDAIDPAWPAAIRQRYGDLTWRGFFMKALSISLPESLSGSGNDRITIAVEDLIADHGSGVSARITANPSLEANVAGWGLSMDSLLLEVLANSVREFRLTGSINIPVMEGRSEYLALFNFPANNEGGGAEVSFTLTLDGTYKLPLLSGSSVELESGSVAGITYRQGKFEPYATLHGRVSIGLDKPSVRLPALEFQDFKVNDLSLPSFGGGGGITGGLDKISFGAFGFGGMRLPGIGGGNSYNGRPSSSGSSWASVQEGPERPGHGPSAAGPADAASVEDPGGGGGGNQKLAGFPITIRNIGFGSAMDGNTSCYKLDFTIGVNFAAGINAFNSEGSFSVWGELDFAKLLSSEPWRTVSYRKTTLESIRVEADLGRVAIEGGINIINDDPVYGNGFKGALAMKVKLPAAEFMVQSVGQFGSIPATAGAEDYRYFFVDAEVGFGQGLQLGNTGLAIYGFSGGFFYNMKREGADPADVAAGKDVAAMPPNRMPDMSGGLLEPGVSLSGTRYVPRRYSTSFQAGLIFGLSAPHTLLADATFGMDINTSSGFAVERIYFTGGAYLMNMGLAERRKGAATIRLRMEMDLLNQELVGSFGMNVSSPMGVPADKAIITGAYNTSLTAVNVFFRFKGQKEYFFYAGTPTDPIKITFQLSSAIKLGSINAYLMVGTQMPGIPTLAEIFAQEGYDLPDNLKEPANKKFIQGDRGVAFGARLRVPKKDYKFLMFSASIQAMAGFDASLMHVDQNLTCGSNGTFGMNNWYMQGQAYGAFKGSISMRINILFYSGTVKIAELEAGAALQAKLPNPTWMMGFLYGRYSVLSGAVKGKFSFKVEMGEICNDLPEIDPLANIQVIQDVAPANYSTVEVYDHPSATFFTKMGETIKVPVVKSDGKEETHYFQCFINTTHTKLTKKGSTQAIPVTITYQDSSYTATFQPKSLLEPNTDYEFTIRIGWKEIKGGQLTTKATYEEQRVTFTTGDMPRKIIAEAVGYHAPGHRQRYWHKNYARPMLEFKQLGWDYLFPKKRTVSFTSGDKNVIDAFREVGWMTKKEGNLTRISREIPLKYVCRVRNTRTNSVVDVDINEVPERTVEEGISFVLEFVELNGYFMPVYRIVKDHVEGKKVRFDDLNKISLAKEQIYALEIIQTPAETVPLPVTTREVANTESYTYNDTLEVITRETVTRQVTPLDQYKNSLQQLIGEEVLYTDYHFGVSKYEHIRYKYYDIVYTDYKSGSWRYDHGHPNTAHPQFRYKWPSYDMYYGFNNPKEPFDHYDQLFLRSNLQLRTDGEYGNPVRQYMWDRQVIEMMDLVGDRANKEVKEMKKVLAKNDAKAQKLRDELSVTESWLQGYHVPLDLFAPVNSEGKSYAGQSGVSILGDGTPSFWYEYKNKKHNHKQDAIRMTAWDYWGFAATMSGNYLHTRGWANQLHFNTSFSNKLTDNEIRAKAMTAWGPGAYPANYPVPGAFSSLGSNVMWIQDSEARIIRYVLQMYKFHAQCLDLLSGALIISKERQNAYRLLRNYYLDPKDPANNDMLYFRLLHDVYANNRLAALKTKKLGFRLRFSHTKVPEYLYSPGIQDGNTRGADINTEAYEFLYGWFGF